MDIGLGNAAQRKRIKYETKCADIGYGFLAFSFSSFGELEKDAVTLLKWIRKFFVALDIGARAAVHIFSRINFIVVKRVRAQIVSQLLTNFMYRIYQKGQKRSKTSTRLEEREKAKSKAYSFLIGQP
ncbi:hypothetical protein Tco_0999389, partial [Tanacetum coccineum]